MTREKLVAELTRDEALRFVVYDDATGKPIRPGSVVVGHPTIGIGRCLDKNGVTQAEAQYLLANDITAVTLRLSRSLPWFDALDDVRQRALVNMTFNLGVQGLLEWHKTLDLLAQKNYVTAADEIERSHPWIDEVGARGKRIAQMIRTGADA